MRLSSYVQFKPTFQSNRKIPGIKNKWASEVTGEQTEYRKHNITQNNSFN